jgi:hypothetical protein
LWSLVLAVLLAPAAGAEVTVPNTFVPGTPINAAAVNANFQALAGAINALGPSARFVACGDGLRVWDTVTGLTWEKKTNPSAAGAGTEINSGDGRTCAASTSSPHPTCADPHDVLNLYRWSSTSMGTAADGAAFTDFLARLNGTLPAGSACFAGHCDWRLPEISELQTILVGSDGSTATGQATTCDTSGPCIDPEFAVLGGRTASSFYWSASSDAASPNGTRSAFFNNGGVGFASKTADGFVRAVRAGSCD